MILMTAGCSDLEVGEADQARETALDFYERLAQQPASACDLLAPGTLEELESTSGPCDRSLPDSEIPAAAAVRHVDVYGKHALVQLDADVAFLANFDDGWRVTAAGCTPRSERPYECSVKGP